MKKERTFRELVVETLRVVNRFQKVEKRKWGVEGAMIELTKQVGDLAKNIMTEEGYYMKGRYKKPIKMTKEKIESYVKQGMIFEDYRGSKEKIADELSDILYLVIRIAAHYKIDLEKEHFRQLEIAKNHPLMKVGLRSKKEKIL
jgi:NTP pyrophosphatase (non-canonical NTP hydrolase)